MAITRKQNKWNDAEFVRAHNDRTKPVNEFRTKREIETRRSRRKKSR